MRRSSAAVRTVAILQRARPKSRSLALPFHQYHSGLSNQGARLRVDPLDHSGLRQRAVRLLPVGDDIARLVRLANVGNYRVVEGAFRSRVVPHAVCHNEVQHLFGEAGTGRAEAPRGE